MDKHVTDFMIGAYLDGEMVGEQLEEFETHLVSCEACRQMADEMDALNNLLDAYPAFDMPVSAKSFTRDVLNRIDTESEKNTFRVILEAGWWMIPLVLIGAWVFLQTFSLVGSGFAVLVNNGVFGDTSSWLSLETESTLWIQLASNFKGYMGETTWSWIQAYDDIGDWVQQVFWILFFSVSISMMYF